ncbi:MAG: BrnT family toxin [Lachnospiraceae bacterium]|nr:BrnT family toxin [Lachnospiraceae bacterium]
MNEMKFEWDLNKALTNVKKHGVSFEEASTVFDDENAILFDDPDHSESEERFMLLGLSIEANMLIVCHCVRKEGSIIRIISARRATKSETKQYIDIVKGW